ncbi:MAG: LegC family aminotransferase [Leptospiraceae bacterium]|nr:LegC family aminotransferase [Leptospiraceae bacterium]
MLTFDSDIIIQKLKETLNYPNEFVSLHEPFFTGNENKYIKECIDTGWVSYLGKFVDKFETQLSEYTGLKHSLAMVNGTSALHIALILAGIKKEDEVLIPTLTFIATANAVSYCNAIPHFIDSEEETLGIDPLKLEEYLNEISILKDDGCINKYTNRKIKALIVMHAFGHPALLDEILEVCNKYKIILIEDAAESLGSYYKGKHTGNWGLISVLSFNGNKILTTGGGGAILTNDSEVAKRGKHLSTTAKVPQPFFFEHDEIGYNYRMPNVNAAIGCAQMEKLSGFIESKRKLTEKYSKNFESIKGIKLLKEPKNAKSNYWLNVLLLDKENIKFRDEILNKSNKEGIMTRPAWNLMHLQKMYKDCPRMDLSVAENLQPRIINIPSSPQLLK